VLRCGAEHDLTGQRRRVETQDGTSMTMWADQSVAEMSAERVLGPVDDDGANPVWDARTKALRYVDVSRGDILTFHAQTGLAERQHVRGGALALRLRRGGWALVTQHGIVSLDATLRPEDHSVQLPGGYGPVTDAQWDPDGALHVVTSSSSTATGAVHRLRTDGGWDALAEGLSDPRGLSFDPARARMYVTDTPASVLVADLDDAGRCGELRPWVIVAAHGTPRGTAIDADGGVWVAVLGGSAVLRYTAEGALDRVVHVAASQVTGCAFGGPDLGDLYITTSPLDPGRAGQTVGSLFRARPGVCGAPVTGPLPVL
jgi:sugar lactone lactonase YvrE